MQMVENMVKYIDESQSFFMPSKNGVFIFVLGFFQCHNNKDVQTLSNKLYMVISNVFYNSHYLFV